MRAGRVGERLDAVMDVDPPPDRHAGRDRRASGAGDGKVRGRRRYAGARSAAVSVRGLAAVAAGPLPGTPNGPMEVRGKTPDGTAWREAVVPSVRDNPAIASAWAHGQVRQLEDRYAAGPGNRSALEKTIIATSLRFGVLCRFTAYVAVDRSTTVNEGGKVHTITQPVEMPAGWGEEVDASCIIQQC